ncbi:MAG: hypothetical protein ACYDCK_08590 [Thermoplasmatota archaeon]
MLLTATALAIPFATALTVSPAPEQKYLYASMSANGDLVSKVITQSELNAMTAKDGYETCAGDAPSTPGCHLNDAVGPWGAITFGFTLPIPSGFTSPAGNVKVHNEQVYAALTSSQAGTGVNFFCDFKETPNSGAPTFRCAVDGPQNWPTQYGASLHVEFFAWMLTTGGNAEKTRTVLGPAGVVIPGLGQYTGLLESF